MTNRHLPALLAVAAVLAAASTAIAQADDSGYNVSTSSTTTIGSDRHTGGATSDDAARMEAIRDAIARQRQSQQR